MLADDFPRNLPFTPVELFSILPRDSKFLNHMSQLWNVSQDPLDHQLPDDIDDVFEIVVVREGHHESQMLRGGHQPQPHLGDNSEIGLREDAIDIRTVAVLERLPCRIVCTISAG